MIAVAPVLLLILTLFTLLLIRLLKPNFAYQWLVAVIGAFIAWAFALISYSGLPIEISVITWQTTFFPKNRLFFIFDRLTWGFSLALATLLLSTILTSAAQLDNLNQKKPSWLALTGSLGITITTLLAVAAGDLILIQITWTVAILFEIICWLPYISTHEHALNLTVEFGIRLLSLMILGWTTFQSLSQSIPAEEFLINPAIQSALLLAAGLRLCILPPFSSPTQAVELPPSLNSVLRLATCAPALMLLARTAHVNTITSGRNLFLILAGIAGVFGGLNLLMRDDERAAKSGWIMAASSLAFAGAVLSLSAPAQIWGITCLLGGGFLFQFTVRARWLMPLSWIMALSLTSLIFTPTWPGTAIYAASMFLTIPLLFSQSLVAAGYLSRSSQSKPIRIGAERWIWVVYFFGLALQPLVLIVISIQLFLVPISNAIGNLSMRWILPGFLISGLSLIFLTAHQKYAQTFQRNIGNILHLLSLSWLYRFLRKIVGPVRYFFIFMNSTLEGQAGLIWSFLILVLLLTVLVQTSAGG